MRSSRFLKPVAYLQRPTCLRPFFSLPSFPTSYFGSSDNKDDDWRRNASSHDEDEPEGNEDEVQRYHERKIMPCVAVSSAISVCSPVVLTRQFFLNRYSQKELYNLVADVDCYRHFLPFCHASKVLHASRPNWKLNPGDGPVELEAELKVGFLGFEESYISRVLCNPYESVEVSIRRYRTLDTTTHTLIFLLTTGSRSHSHSLIQNSHYNVAVPSCIVSLAASIDVTYSYPCTSA